MSDNAQVKGEIPQYELTEAAYIDDKYLEAGAKITYQGEPGHHMAPLNAAAEAAKKKARNYLDPILAMTAVN